MDVNKLHVLISFVTQVQPEKKPISSFVQVFNHSKNAIVEFFLAHHSHSLIYVVNANAYNLILYSIHLFSFCFDDLFAAPFICQMVLVLFVVCISYPHSDFFMIRRKALNAFEKENHIK